MIDRMLKDAGCKLLSAHLIEGTCKCRFVWRGGTGDAGNELDIENISLHNQQVAKWVYN